MHHLSSLCCSENEAQSSTFSELQYGCCLFWVLTHCFNSSIARIFCDYEDIKGCLFEEPAKVPILRFLKNDISFTGKKPQLSRIHMHFSSFRSRPTSKQTHIKAFRFSDCLICVIQGRNLRSCAVVMKDA